MIRIENIRNVRYEKYDEVWAIVRSMKNTSQHMKQVPELSPSLNLFFKYRELANSKQWSKETFDKIYVPQFIHEMHEKTAIDKLNELWQRDKNGENICLTCFCTTENMCHRSIVAGLLQGVGCDVQTERNTNYSKYYGMWKQTT